MSPDGIRATVERAAAGEPMLSGEIAGRVLREFERERQEERYREQLAALTAREEEILKLLATGESNREIGRRLFISEQTVKNHVASIFRKLQVNERTKAPLLAMEARPRRERLGVRVSLTSVLRGVVIALGTAVAVASLFFFRLDDWPIYVVYVLLCMILYRPTVEVLPNMGLPLPGLALTIGFLYVGGLPIVPLTTPARQSCSSSGR